MAPAWREAYGHSVMIGTRLANRYELVGELGAGGMGVVYRARDPWLERDVAVKLIPPLRLDERSAERFQREARLVAQLDHPGIVPIHDFGQHDEVLFFVMPIVEGMTLRELLDAGPLDAREASTVVAEIAEALVHAHDRGIVHRDVKPSNVMVSRGESSPGEKPAGQLRARIMDFGLARGQHESRVSQSGQLAGTPAYLSPEQVKGLAADARSDLYSLGAVFYECLAGRPPFDGALASIIYRIGHDPPPPFDPSLGIDAELEHIARWCLEKEPDRRPASGSLLVAALRAWLHPRRDAAPDPNGGELMASSARASAGDWLPLVGRQREWQLLVSGLDRALRGECRLVLLGGEVGMGKSRLVHELERLAADRGVSVLRGRYSDLETSFHYEGLCEVVQDYFRNLAVPLSSSSRGSAVQGSDSIPDFSDLAPELLARFPVLAEVPELRNAAGSVGPLGGDRGDKHGRATYVFELFARTLTRLAGGRALVVALENLHEADASIEALQYLVHRLAASPILIVGTYRWTEAGRGHPLRRWIRSLRDHRRASDVRLEPFTAEELRQLAELVLGSSRIRGELMERLEETTEGNPLFAREILRSLLETGELVRDTSGFWSLTGEAAITYRALPSTLQQAVERRLERLPDELRRTLAAAAVLGKSFDGGDLAWMLAETPPGASRHEELDEVIDQLIDQGFLREDHKARGDRLVFESNLVRTVLYQDLPRRRRRALHRRYARVLEERAEGRLERHYPQLVHHFSAGDVPEKTVEYALAQARTSLAAWNPDDAIRAARIALEFVDDDEITTQAGGAGLSGARGEILDVLARAHRSLGQHSQALDEARRAVAAFHDAALPRRGVEAAWSATQAAWHGRLVDDTRHWVDRTVDLARAEGMDDVVRRALLLGSTVANLRGDTELARRYRDEAAKSAPADDGAAQESLESGGTLRAALPISPGPLDPAEIDSEEHGELIMTVFETLLQLDREGNLLPSLCADWSVSDEGRRFELELASGVRFSDGTPLDAAAVKSSLERLARRRIEAPPSALATLAGREAFLAGETDGIHGIAVDDKNPRKLIFILDESLPIFPVFLSDPYTAVAFEGPEGEDLRGTGAFQVGSHEQGLTVLERNELFRGRPARLDRLEFHTGLKPAEIAEGLRGEELDLGRDLFLDDLEDLLRDPRFRTGIVETTRKNVHFLLWNRHGPHARHPELRRALSAAVDPSELVWRTMGRFAQPAVCLIPPGVAGHDPGRRRRRLTAEESRALLAEAPFPQPDSPAPVRLRAVAHPVFLRRGRELIRTLFDVWWTLGVDVELRELEIGAYLDAYQNPAGIDLILGRWNADYDDPDSFTYSLFHSHHGVFRRYYASKKTDRLLELARKEASMTLRQDLYRRFESLLEADDACLPLFHDIAYRLAGPRVRGLRLENVPPFVNYADVAKAGGGGGTVSRWPLERGELHVPIVAPLASIDPVADTLAEHLEVVSTVFEGLTRLDENAAVVPWLARSFETDPGGRVVRFRLREDVHFHDGRRFTARDVRYSFERALRHPRAGLQFLLLPIRGAAALRQGEASTLSGLEILSTYELAIELEEPLPYFPALLAHPGNGIVADGTESFTGSWRDGCVGTGAFRVVRFEPGGAVELERHPQYWRPGQPKSARLTFHTGLDPRRIAAEFRSGSFSLASDLYPDDIEALRRDAKLARSCLEAPRLSTVFVVFNTRRGPLADPALRQALVAALDFDALFRRAAGPRSQRACGLIPPGLIGHEDPREHRVRPLDPAVLRGLRLKAAAISGYIGQHAALWEQLQNDLRRLGVRLDEVRTQVSRLVETRPQDLPDILAMRWLADYPDPDSFVSGLLHSRDGILSGMCARPDVDRLCESARRELDPALRHAQYREIEELLAREAIIAPLVHEQSIRFRHPSVEGVRVYFALPEIRYEEIRVRR